MATKGASEKIKKFMRAGYSMTQRIAIIRYQHYRLAVVIERWRKEGAVIDTKREQTESGAIFARYRLIGE